MNKREVAKGKWGRYEFTITMAGYGNNPEEAWNDAVEGFCLDSGDFPRDYTFEEEVE